MGFETTCLARVDDGIGIRQAASRVLLETDGLIVRGEARIKVPRASIQRITTRAGVLTITSPTATVSLTLGVEAAAKWRKKLEAPPKALIDKLDVKPDAKVWLRGTHDAALVTQLHERTSRVLRGNSAAACDVIFVSVASEAELDRVDQALNAIAENGAIWVVHPKGPKGVADTTIFARATALGLVSTKVARISETHTAEKLVKPLASRTTGTTAARRR